jgi:hypothetical protein
MASGLIYSTGEVKNMTILILIAQGAFIGYMAQIAFGTGVEYFAAIAINALLVVGYGVSVSTK